MSGSHPKLEAWDMAVHEAIVAVEHELEKRYGLEYPLRRNRPAHGVTANPQFDGLFNLGLVFTPGYGSELGRGYWLDLEIASGTSIPEDRWQLFTETARDLLERELHRRFPDRGLRFQKDGGRWKLQGDFGLGTV